jgi:2,3-bisphosphoglycerate-independent phosphoglycerate mutase
MMIDEKTRGPHTYHTTSPVPFLFITNEQVALEQNGALEDVAPTLLGILGLEKPGQMKGRDLRKRR